MAHQRSTNERGGSVAHPHCSDLLEVCWRRGQIIRGWGRGAQRCKSLQLTREKDLQIHISLGFFHCPVRIFKDFVDALLWICFVSTHFHSHFIMLDKKHCHVLMHWVPPLVWFLNLQRSIFVGMSAVNTSQDFWSRRHKFVFLHRARAVFSFFTFCFSSCLVWFWKTSLLGLKCPFLHKMC